MQDTLLQYIFGKKILPIGIDNQKLQELQKVLLANEPEKLEEMLNEILNQM